MTAEAIAHVVAELKAGQVRRARPPSGFPANDQLCDAALALIDDPVIVDITSIFDATLGKKDGIWLYEDHPCIAPPWQEAALSFVNGYGNVHVVHLTAIERESDAPAPWEPANDVDWSQVRWLYNAFLYLGGIANGQPTKAAGPLFLWRYAVYADGQPADLHWVMLTDDGPDTWSNAQLTLLGALNFMNCRNIDIVEPARPRAVRRRLQRDHPGVVINTIHVFPSGKTRRSTDKGEPLGTAHHPVVGNFGHYGACCSHHEARGLLFGKYEGRFYRPPHTRGSKEHGEHETNYELRTR